MNWSTQLVAELQEEIRRTEILRYAHRLHGVLLVAQGLTYPAAAELLGESVRTLVYWVRRYQDKGLAGLREEKRSGRPQRLGETQLNEITGMLRQSPECAGVVGGRWTARMLAGWIEERFGIRVSVTQCKRILRKLRVPSGGRGGPKRQQPESDQKEE